MEMIAYLDSLPVYAQVLVGLCILSYMIVIAAVLIIIKEDGFDAINKFRTTIIIILSPITIFFMIGEYIQNSFKKYKTKRNNIKNGIHS